MEQRPPFCTPSLDSVVTVGFLEKIGGLFGEDRNFIPGSGKNLYNRLLLLKIPLLLVYLGPMSCSRHSRHVLDNIGQLLALLIGLPSPRVPWPAFCDQSEKAAILSTKTRRIKGDGWRGFADIKRQQIRLLEFRVNTTVAQMRHNYFFNMVGFGYNGYHGGKWRGKGGCKKTNKQIQRHVNKKKHRTKPKINICTTTSERYRLQVINAYIPRLAVCTTAFLSSHLTKDGRPSSG